MDHTIKEVLDSYKAVRPAKISDLLILGLLSHRNLGGYDIYKFIEGKADRSGSLLRINKTTVYNTLSRMTDEGLVRITEQVRESKRPVKSIYTLTEKGKTRLRELLINNFGVPPILFINFFLDLTCYNVLTKEEIKKGLAIKIDQIQSLIEISKLYAQTVPQTIFGSLVESEIEIFQVILKTSKHLLKILDKTPLDELFNIQQVEEDTILTEMENMRLKDLKGE
ncbi:MAG: helix-turn-helix transcriptional regulator [Theionarchaea archaeon]|nr:helix-turn-helix transcriptional regulator [Theionarchaea archaeon]